MAQGRRTQRNDDGQSGFRGQPFPIAQVLADFYVVPEYQREYAWEEEHVRAMLLDVLDASSLEDDSKRSPYFLGGIVCTEGMDRRWEVVDGQQRLTTLFIALCALRDVVLHADSSTQIDTIKSTIRSTRMNDQGEEVSEFRIELQYEDSHQILEEIGMDRQGDILDAEVVEVSSPSVQRMLEAYMACISFFQTELQGNPRKCKLFYHHLAYNTYLVRVETGSRTSAFQVFETLNDRGVGLTTADLLKNLLFMESAERDFPAIHKTWKNAFDRMYRCNQKPKKVLRYFVLSDINEDKEGIGEDKVYRWLRTRRSQPEIDIAAKPLAFVERLDSFTEEFERILDCKDAAGRTCPALQELKVLTRTGTQHLIVLLAARHWPHDLFSRLARELENLIFLHVATNTVLRELEGDMVNWASHLRGVKSPKDSDLDTFIEDKILPKKKKLADSFRSSMATLQMSDFPKYRQRYILGRLAHHIQERCAGDTAGLLMDYVEKSYDIEHIHPRDVNIAWWPFEDEEDRQAQLESLANLLLLEEGLNRSAGKQPYDKKREYYANSSLHFARIIAGSKPPKGQHKTARAYNELSDGAFETWSKQDLEARREWIVRLACDVWGVPHSKTLMHPPMDEVPVGTV